MRQLFYSIFASILIFFVSQAHAVNLNIKEPISTDSVITTNITKQLAGKTNLTHEKITVSTQNNIVKLTGEVNDKQTFADVYWIARSTKDVRLVDIDELEIKHINTTLSDAYITAKVETAVLKAKILDDESIPLVGINATTANGIVTLTGEVKKNKSISAILKRANAVHGVKKIISSLHVKGETKAATEK